MIAQPSVGISLVEPLKSRQKERYSRRAGMCLAVIGKRLYGL